MKKTSLLFFMCMLAIIHLASANTSLINSGFWQKSPGSDHPERNMLYQTSESEAHTKNQPLEIPGSTCENPILVNPYSEPLINFAINSEPYGNNYSSNMVTPTTNYLNGNDVVFQFTITSKSFVNASIQGTWTGLTFVESCPNATTPPARLYFAGGGSGATLSNLVFEAGTYFMIAGTWPAPQFADMVINLSAVTIPENPLLSTTPAELFVGWATPGMYTESKALTLSNQGQEDLIINDGGFAFSGANASDFSVSLNTGDTYPLTIPFNQTKTIIVNFNPAAAGDASASLDITYNNPGNPVKSVTVSGLGYLPKSNFSENFDGLTPIPSGSLWLPDGWGRIVQSSNTNAYVRILTSTPFSAPNQVTFASSSDLSAQLFLVSPTATNFAASRLYFTARMGSSTHTGTLQVGYLTNRTDPSSFVNASTVSITGSWALYSIELGTFGITFPENAFLAIRYVPEVTNRIAVLDNIIYELMPTQPIFNANKMDFDFGSTTWMYESSTQLLQIYNSGQGNLIINESDIAIAGSDPEAFSVIYPDGHTWPISLAFGQAINLNIKFSPSEGRAYSALLNITDNISGKALNTITLDGTGYDAIIEPGFQFNFVGTYPPKDWRRHIGLLGVEDITLTTASVWVSRKFANNTALPANNSAGINIFGTGRKHWLMTPPINLGDGSQNYQLEFDLALTAKNTSNPANFGTDQKFAVVISTDGGQSWSADNVLQTWNSSTPVSATGERIYIDLTGFTDRVMIGFYGESTVTGGDVDLFITNVDVNEFVELTPLPLSEDFEATEFPSEGWWTYNIDNTSPAWASSSAQNNTPSGAKSAYHAKGAAGQPQDGWLVTPLMQIPAQTPIVLKFWSKNTDVASYGKNSVLVSTGSRNPADNDYVEVWTSSTVSDQWIETTLDLSSYTNQTIYIAFRYEGDNAHEWYLDDISLFVNTSPVIAVQPGSINKTQVANVTSTASFIITNNGIDNLVYNITIEYLTGDEGWLSTNPSAGNVQGGGFSQSHTASLNSTGLSTGTHTANIIISSNDIDNPVVEIPVSLNVLEPTVVQLIPLTNQYTYPLDISQDGKYVLYTSFGSGGNMLWSEETGNHVVTGSNTSAVAVSDEGLISGTYNDPNLLYNGNPVQVAGIYNYRTSQWTFHGMNPLAPEFTSTSYSSGYGITADGETTALMQYVNSMIDYRAAIWNADAGYTMIGTSHTQGHRPNGINKSGNLVFGWAQTTVSRSPVLYQNGQIIYIDPTLSGEARGATPTGSYATGSAGGGGFLWSADGNVTFFSNSLNAGTVNPTTVLEDGTIFGFTAEGFPALPPGRRAFVRYMDGSMITFNEYALSRGLADADQWLFYSINGATPDGNQFIGAGINPDGQDVTFKINFDVKLPSISIDPEEVNETLTHLETSSQDITISNEGTSELSYNLYLQFVSELKSKKDVQTVEEGVKAPAQNIELGISASNGATGTAPLRTNTFPIHYDGANANAIGLTAGGTFHVLARYTAEMLDVFEGSTIQSIDAYIAAATTATEIRIYDAGTTTAPGALLFSQEFTPNIASWNNIVLNTPLELSGNDIWVGLVLTHAPSTWVMGVDAGPANPNGDYLSDNGTTWTRLSDYGFNANWNVRANIDLGTGEWISLSNNSGIVEAGESDVISLSFDATNVLPGTYQANILVLC